MSDDSSFDWEETLRRAAADPDPRVPSKDESDQDFKLVAELILHHAGAPGSESAWAKAHHARGRAAKEIIAERVRRKWGNDKVLDFFSDCRLLAGLTWSHDPTKLKEAVTEIEAARKGLEKARQGSNSRYAREAIERAISKLVAYSEPITRHLGEIDYKRAGKNWAAYEFAWLACGVFERWIGGEISAKRDSMLLGGTEPAAGFPSFVRDLLVELDIDAHWERPVKEAVKKYQESRR